MYCFDVFRTKGGRFWYVLWNPNMSRPLFLSDLYISLDELLPAMVKTAREKGVSLGTLFDPMGIPAKFDKIASWREKEMLVEAIDVWDKLRPLLIPQSPRIDK